MSFAYVPLLFLGKKTPGIYIVEKCSSTPVCPCLSIISEELKFHESCKDMFYFTTRGYLVHVNTGHCLTWSVDKFVLNQFCTESFSVHINGIIKHQNNNCLYPEGGVGPPIHDKSVNLISDSASCSKFNFAYDVPRPEAAYNIECKLLNFFKTFWRGWRVTLIFCFELKNGTSKWFNKCNKD